jgi:hypothetical protein
MKTLAAALLLCATSFLLAATAAPRTVDAGLIVSVSRDFINEYKNTFNMEFVKRMQQSYLTDVEKHFEASILDVRYRMENITIAKAVYNPRNTKIAIAEKKPQFFINLEDCDFEVNFDYILETTPELVSEHGSGVFEMQDLNLTVKASPFVKDNFFQFELADVIIDMSDFNLTFKGGDIAFLIDNFSDTLKEFVREYIVGQMEEPARKALESMVNDMLLREPREIDVDGDQVEVDYRFVGDGVQVTDDFFSIIMDGTVSATSQKGKNRTQSDKYSKMPLHD